jgi:hypothetical protein
MLTFFWLLAGLQAEIEKTISAIRMTRIEVFFTNGIFLPP